MVEVLGVPGVFLSLSVLGERLAVCRLDPRERVSVWVAEAPFFSVTRTPEELSVVCPEQNLPSKMTCEKGWRALKIESQLDFSLMGVLASITAPLAEAGVSIFAISTYDTDYVLVREEALDTAVAALREAGHEIRDTATGFAVRPAVAEDESFLWEMLYEAVYREPGESGPKPPPYELLAEPGLRRYLEGWGREGDFAIVARDAGDGRKVGAAWYRLFPASDPGYGFVNAATPEIAIAVVPDRRGTGVGGNLLRALMDTARSNGFDAVSLSVQKINHAATRLYERNGFVRLRDDGDSWTMKAELHDDRATNDARGA